MFTNLLVQRLAIIRNVDTGVLDTYRHPVRAASVIAYVDGTIQPMAVREVALLSDAGVAVSDHTVFMAPTDVREADVIRTEPDDGRRYQVRGVRDAAGRGHHLEVDVAMVATRVARAGS